MAVREETFAPDALAVAHGAPAPKFEGIRRAKDGRWMFLYRVAVRVRLPDGREIESIRPVDVPATYQRGRRPARCSA